MREDQIKLVFTVILSFVLFGFSITDLNDLRILNEFKNGLENPELLKWPRKGEVDNDPCGPPSWPHVFCSGDRVTQIQVQDMGLKGPLPQDFNQLTELTNLGLQRNQFNGKLPTFNGLSRLQRTYLGSNLFDTIPSDFFNGLDNLQVLSLDDNPLNKTKGWFIPIALQNSPQLTNLSVVNCNLIGPIPDFLGNLAVVKLSYNRLSGGIPLGFNQSELQILWLNNQGGDQLSGPIDLIASMVSLTQLWLQGNKFTGTIPANIGALPYLMDLNLNGNKFVGQIPESLANKELQKLDLSNNYFMGSIPKFKSGNVSYFNNHLCQSDPEIPCSREVTILIDFIGGLNYPLEVVSAWHGNDPCQGPWLGLGCNRNKKVSIINLRNYKLNGTLSPSIGKLDTLIEIRLEGNNVIGRIPTSLTGLKSLRLLNISGNNVEPPLPEFSSGVKVVTNGNTLLNGGYKSATSPTIGANSNDSSPSHDKIRPKFAKKFTLEVIVAPLVCFGIFVLLVVLICRHHHKKRKGAAQAPSSVLGHPRDWSDPENMVKILIPNDTNQSLSTVSGSSGLGESHVIGSGNHVISLQVLRNVTKNFAPENEIGCGGFGTVYKGDFDDGTQIAVQRMEVGMLSKKGLDEFEAEIAVLSKVRHRHLVYLLGYSIEANERLLVYEYVPRGALSKHLFDWERLKLEPLSWKRRLNIALDVARGIEYLHSLANEKFIHRDLKSSKILLGDDYRAKVSDFGLVKLAVDGEKSMATKFAGTMGYLAPEYAVSGKITSKVDILSYGVVLMELVTGLMATDENQPEDCRYLAPWFWHIKSSKEMLRATIDPSLAVNEETFESICIIAELAGHCTARELNQHPDMSHVVSVLTPLVEKWTPFDEASVPLTQMVENWQEEQESIVSIPPRPEGFAEPFNSSDGR